MNFTDQNSLKNSLKPPKQPLSWLKSAIKWKIGNETTDESENNTDKNNGMTTWTKYAFCDQ